MDERIVALILKEAPKDRSKRTATKIISGFGYNFGEEDISYLY
jgi:hypothetical protein